MLLAVFLGRLPHIFAEETGEIVVVLDTYLETDLVDVHIGGGEEAGSIPHLLVVEVVQWTVSGILLEDHGEMAAGISGEGRDITQGEFLLDILVHEMDGRFHDVVIGRTGSTFFSTVVVAEQTEIADRSQVIMEQGRGIAQILDGQTTAEGMIDVLEELVAVVDSGVDGRCDALGNRCTLGIDLRMFAREMNPIDGPGIIIG